MSMTCSLMVLVISREDPFCLIGLDFLQPHNAIINLKKHMLLLEVDGVRPPTNTTATTSQEHPVVIEVPFVEVWAVSRMFHSLEHRDDPKYNK